MMNTERFLVVDRVSYSYDSDILVLKNVSFSVGKGEIFTIIGPNGAGKSTLLNCLTGILKVNSGEILVEGKNIKSISDREFAKHVAYVSQGQSKVYDFEVREYVAMGRAPYIGFAKSPSKADYELVDAAMEKMGLTRLAHKAYTHISGGECQRAMIARAMVQQADLIIMDEPTNHLDYGNQIKVLKQIQTLAKDGFSVIWTTHIPDHALMLGGKTAILDSDGSFTIGNAEELLTEERLTRLYKTKICRTYVDDAEREACVPYRLTEN